MSATKICPGCNTNKKLSEYTPSKYIKSGAIRLCKECNNLQVLLKKRGITLDIYETLSKRCELCGATDKICIDHDHNTGKVRGGLCSNCNSGIGMFGDNVDLLKKALDYLLKHKSSSKPETIIDEFPCLNEENHD